MSGAPESGAESRPPPAVEQVDDFYDWLSSMALIAHRRHLARDVRGLTAVIGRLNSMRGKCRADPQLATLESSTVQCVLMLAELHSDELLFDECFALCADVKRILEDKAARFRAAGRRPRPDSTAWCRLVTTLGDAKWKAPAKFVNAVLSPADMIAIYLNVEAKIREGLAKAHRSPQKEREIKESLMWCAVAVLCTAMRHSPEATPNLRSAIADWHGDIIQDSNQPSYWRISLVQLLIARCNVRQEWARCYAALRNALLESKAIDFNPKAFDYGVRKELEYLMAINGNPAN